MRLFLLCPFPIAFCVPLSIQAEKERVAAVQSGREALAAVIAQWEARLLKEQSDRVAEVAALQVTFLGLVTTSLVVQYSSSMIDVMFPGCGG